MCFLLAVVIGSMVGVRPRDLNPDSKTAQLRPHPTSPLETDNVIILNNFTMELVRNTSVC